MEVVLASMLVGLVSSKDMLMTVIRRSGSMLAYGVKGSLEADHAKADPPQLHSMCTARQGEDNKLLHTTPQLLLPSLAPLYTNTSGESGHQVTHSVVSTHHTGYTIICSIWR